MYMHLIYMKLHGYIIVHYDNMKLRETHGESGFGAECQRLGTQVEPGDHRLGLRGGSISDPDCSRRSVRVSMRIC